MANAMVSVMFEAADADEANNLIANWKLHEGCQVSVTVTENAPIQMTDSEGKVVDVPPPEPPSEPPPEVV